MVWTVAPVRWLRRAWMTANVCGKRISQRPAGGGPGTAQRSWSNNKTGFFLFSETGDLILARLTPEGYDELDRFHVLEPTGEAFGRDVVWSHPAFADRSVFARNDKELVCVDLAAARVNGVMEPTAGSRVLAVPECCRERYARCVRRHNARPRLLPAGPGP